MNSTQGTRTVRVRLILDYDVDVDGWAAANDCPATPESVTADVRSYWTAERLIRPGAEPYVTAPCVDRLAELLGQRQGFQP